MRGRFSLRLRPRLFGEEPREKPRSRAGIPNRIDIEHHAVTWHERKQRRRARPCSETTQWAADKTGIVFSLPYRASTRTDPPIMALNRALPSRRPAVRAASGRP